MTKIKIEEKYRAKYVPIVLYWDDVSEIFDILQANAKSVELETATYKFTQLAAAKEHFGDAAQFDVKISASTPYCTIEAGQLYVGSGQASAQIFLSIDRILKARERRPRWIYSGWRMLPVVMILGFVGFTPFDEVTKGVLTAVQLALVVAFVFATYVSIRRELVVHTQRKSEARGFLERNKDQLLMYLITGVIGALVGFGISQVKDRYFPPTTQSKSP